MDKPIDLTSERNKRGFVMSVVKANELAYGVPQCKLVRDFLAAHDLPWRAFYMPLALSHEQWSELSRCMSELYTKIQAEHKRLCEEYGVSTEAELFHEQRVFFDKALRTFIEREDHYYVERGAGE